LVDVYNILWLLVSAFLERRVRNFTWSGEALLIRFRTDRKTGAELAATSRTVGTLSNL